MSDGRSNGDKWKDVEVVSFSNGNSGGGTNAPFPELNKDGEPFGGFALIINGHSLVSSPMRLDCLTDLVLFRTRHCRILLNRCSQLLQKSQD